MDVTCERCATEYEFDDALVSDKGTTVKCTSCGHQFKVRRTDGVKAPERWVIRTLDGRELEFRALRELQSAIAQLRVTRDDVLSRGTSRPRRLGSIAELDPFFATAGSSINAPRPSSYPSNLKSTVIGVGPRERSTTPAGLGDPMAQRVGSEPGAGPREETSVAIPLPKAWVAFPPPAQTSHRQAIEEAPSTERVHPAGERTGESGGAVSPPPLARSEDEPVTARRAARENVPGSPGPLSEGKTQPFAKRAPVLENLPGSASGDAQPGEAITKAGSSEPPSSDGLTSELQKTSRMEAARSQETSDRSNDARVPSSSGHSSDARAAQPPPPPAPGLPPPVAAEPPPSDPEPVTHPRRETLPVDSKPRVGAPAGSFDEHAVSSEPPMAVGRPPPISAPATPTPSDVRVSYMMGGEDSLGEPRFSSAAMSRGSGGLKLILALVIGGAVVFLAVVFGRRWLVPDAEVAPAVAAQDERVVELLNEGKRQLDEGDLLAAKEQFDKASALAEADPRIALSLAKLAVAHAEVPWLRLRLLEPTDPDRDAAKRELAYAIVRVEQAVERARELDPDEPDLARVSIDAKRLAGERDAARELVQSLPGGAASEDNALPLGALDLAEDQPPWPTVIDRLTKAAAAEKNLGRARALLVYSLARAKETERARAEYARLQALPRAHPLLAAFRPFLERAEKGDVEPVDVDSLPDVDEDDAADPSIPATGEAAGAPDSSASLLAEAHAARARGDLSQAEELYIQVLTKNAGNTEAQTGLADIARARGQGDKAMALYQKVLSSNPNYFPALVALADMKWSSGDQSGAKALYLKILEHVGSGPIADKARERLGQGPTAPVPPPVPAPSAPPSAPPPGSPPGTVPDDYVAPDQPSIDTSDLPGHSSDIQKDI